MRPEEKNKTTAKSFHPSSSEGKKTSVLVGAAETHRRLTHQSRSPTSSFAFRSHAAQISPIHLIQRERLQVPKAQVLPTVAGTDRIGTPGWAGSFPPGGCKCGEFRLWFRLSVLLLLLEKCWQLSCSLSPSRSLSLTHAHTHTHS